MHSIPVERRKSGFTLIELLVVIAIIAILAAILFPVFARARENARRASCQSNEKNIALGFKQYIQDNGEKYPPRIKYAPDLMSSASGTGALAEYIKSTAIFICPSDSAKIGSYGYMLNAENESSLEPVSERVLLKETSAKRHFDGQNMAFVDGHVKWGKGDIYGEPAQGALQPPAADTYPSSQGFTTWTAVAGASGSGTLSTCRTTDPRCVVPAAATAIRLDGWYGAAADVTIEWAGKTNDPPGAHPNGWWGGAGNNSHNLDVGDVSGDFEVTISHYVSDGVKDSTKSRTWYFTKG